MYECVSIHAYHIFIRAANAHAYTYTFIRVYVYVRVSSFIAHPLILRRDRRPHVSPVLAEVDTPVVKQSSSMER